MLLSGLTLSDLVQIDTEKKAITMSTKKPIVVGLFLSLLFIIGKSELKLDFYERSCPKVETIVRNTVNKYISRAPSLAAPILRMHFHDCFARVRYDSIPYWVLSLHINAIPFFIFYAIDFRDTMEQF